jgi:protein TonB
VAPARRFSAGIAIFAMLRWGSAAAIVLGAHGGVAWLALREAPAQTMQSDAPPAVMIELASVALAPEAPQQEVAPGPQAAEAQPETEPEPQAEPIPEPQPVARPEPEPIAQPEPPPPEVKPAEIRPPELPQQEKAEAVLAPPPPPAKPKQHKKKPKVKQAERKKPIDPDRQAQRRTSAPPAAKAERAERLAAPSAGTAQAPSVSPASWKGALGAHLNRYKRFPSDANGAGTASVAFTIARSGQVLSARLVRSSGDAALDREAVALPRRASPVPAPPDGFGGATVTLSVPIRFNR